MMSKTVFMSLAAALVALALITSSQGHRCVSRRSPKNVKAGWGVLEKEGECKPVVVPVPVQVEGYELLTPNTVMLKRCHATHGCPMRQCVSTKTVPKNVKVECWKFGMKNAQCVEFKTFEDEECDCGCQPQMCDNKIQDFVESMCKCTCKERIMKDCRDLIEMVGADKMMYYPSKCECTCTQPLICAFGEMFDRNICKCVATSHMMKPGN